MDRNFYRIFTENNPVMGDSKTFGIPEAKGLSTSLAKGAFVLKNVQCLTHVFHYFTSNFQIFLFHLIIAILLEGRTQTLKILHISQNNCEKYIFTVKKS